jgi:hypothetical protein
MATLKGGIKMSHRNYSKYSEQPKEEVTKQISAEEIIPEVSDDQTTTEIITENVSQEPELVIGIVDNTERLRVRKEDNVDSEILCILEKDSEVNIDLQNSTEFFYKIMTSAGVEGYCMRNFIKLK